MRWLCVRALHQLNRNAAYAPSTSATKWHIIRRVWWPTWRNHRYKLITAVTLTATAIPVSSLLNDQNRSDSPTDCDLAPVEQHSLAAAAFDSLLRHHETGFIHSVWWNIRIILRAIRLFVVFTPIFITYPFVQLTSLTLELWWRLVLIAVSYSGPTVVKLAQWAATRRDLFTADFCNRFQTLQRNVQPRPWSQTERVLIETFGPDWDTLFRRFDRHPIGSGCIAQVFRAVIDPIEFDRKTNANIKELHSLAYLPVAVKITHEAVIREIQLDMTILDWGARFVQTVIPSLRYLHPTKCIADFRAVMEKQVDLRHEGRSLVRFARNFSSVDNIRFPTPLMFTSRILIETFEEGLHISTFIPDPSRPAPSEETVRLQNHLASVGVRAVCQMIFQDNFVHGDLHPGNILVQNHERVIDPSLLPLRTRMQRRAKAMCNRVRDSVRRVFGHSELTEALMCKDDLPEPDPTLVFLDTGITTELTKKDLENFRAVFLALLNADGERIGRLMLQPSVNYEHFCVDDDKFCAAMQTMVAESVLKDGKIIALREFDISRILSDLLTLVSTHKVSLEPNFTCVVLAIMLLEGLGRSLDPDLDLLGNATPFLLKAR